MRIDKVVFSCSLCLALAMGALADFSTLSKKVHDARTLADAQAALKAEPDAMSDSRLKELSTAKDSNALERIRDAVDLRAKLETGKPAGDVGKIVSSVKRSPLYSDPAIKKQSNWLKDAWENFLKLFNRKEQPEAPKLDVPWLGPWVIGLMYIALGVILLVFLWFVAKSISFARSRRRKAVAVLEDDEPERTLDEWLEMAAKFEGEGRFREAVRCLYLACLLRFDESGVARFVRGETNWEHLKRIKSSPKLPIGLEFTEPTRAFDRIWYGFKVKGSPDVDDFRNWYLATTNALKEVTA